VKNYLHVWVGRVFLGSKSNSPCVVDTYVTPSPENRAQAGASGSDAESDSEESGAEGSDSDDGDHGLAAGTWAWHCGLGQCTLPRVTAWRGTVEMSTAQASLLRPLSSLTNEHARTHSEDGCNWCTEHALPLYMSLFRFRPVGGFGAPVAITWSLSEMRGVSQGRCRATRLRTRGGMGRLCLGLSALTWMPTSRSLR
jgi:hypothetical protein